MFPPSVPSVDATAVPDGAHILDVREDDEWVAGHIEGAQHIPLADLPVRYGELPADTGVVVVCRSGGRSSRAVAWLSQNGVDAVNLDGDRQHRRLAAERRAVPQRPPPLASSPAPPLPQRRRPPAKW